MSKLVTADQMISYLNLDDQEDFEIIQEILDAAEDMLERECNRVFGIAGTVVDEVHDGTGTKTIFADKPIASLTQVRIGRKKEETIIHTDADVLTFKVGSRKLQLISRKWTAGTNNVWLDYTSQADLPELAKSAVKEAVAIIYRKRGKEDSRSEKAGDYSQELVKAIDESLTWKQAVNLLHRPSLG